jgi:hypothetical protein
VKIADISAAYTGGALAFGFFTAGQVPSETPEHRNSWTMIRGNAQQTGAQDTVIPEGMPAELKWIENPVIKGVYSAVLYAQGYVFIKFGPSAQPFESTFACYTVEGDKVWEFSFPAVNNFDICSSAIIGDYIYIPSSYGYIFKVPWKVGPGANNENVTTFGGKVINKLDINNREGALPNVTAPLTGWTFNNGPSSISYDSGVIYFGACNGMVYCYDLNLNLIWSYQTGGCGYFFAPTIYKDYLFIGALDGTLNVLDKKSGALIDKAVVYTKTMSSKTYGGVQQISVFEENSKMVLMFGVSDGRGLSAMTGGVGVYEFDGSKLTKRVLILEKFGLVSNCALPVENSGFKGIYFTGTKGLFRIDVNGNYELLNDM